MDRPLALGVLVPSHENDKAHKGNDQDQADGQSGSLLGGNNKDYYQRTDRDLEESVKILTASWGEAVGAWGEVVAAQGAVADRKGLWEDGAELTGGTCSTEGIPPLQSSGI